jgi:hypothetical protein
MKVDIAFSDTNNGIEVRLHQSGIENTDDGRVMGHLNCRSCWIFFMTNLLSVLQHGNDLRDNDPSRVSSVEIDFQPLDS